MKKINLLLLGFFAMIGATRAQAYEGSTQYDKKKQAAIVSEYAYPPQAVENAFVERMEKLGYRAKEEKGILNRDKGFLVFKNAYINDISKDRLDYCVKVERKGRKDKEEAILYLIIQKEGENAMEKLESYDIGRAKSYLNNMLPDIEAANLELQIKAQEEVVSKAEKKLKGLQDDKLALENKLAENVKSQDETLKDLEAQKASLENLRGRRQRN